MPPVPSPEPGGFVWVGRATNKDLKKIKKIREANERLQQAVKENNMGVMLVVSALMEVVQKKIDEGGVL